MTREEIIGYVQSVIDAELPESTSAYLFGSYASATENETSDVDLAIVCSHESDNPRNLVRTLYKRLTRFELDYDIIGYTKKQFLETIRTNPFTQNILREGLLVHGLRIS